MPFHIIIDGFSATSVPPKVLVSESVNIYRLVSASELSVGLVSMEHHGLSHRRRKQGGQGASAPHYFGQLIKRYFLPCFL